MGTRDKLVVAKMGECMEKSHFTMKEMPETEQPYEKCEKYGVGSLSEAELLAVVIRTGYQKERAIEVAQRVLKECCAKHGCNGLIGLPYLTLNELVRIKGIGRVKAIQLACVAELAKRMVRAGKTHGESLTTPEMVAERYMEEMRHLEREQITLILLDGKNRIIKDVVVSTGTVNASMASPREVFYLALKYGAVRIILMHNHPSGDPTPSEADLAVTAKMKETGVMVGVPLVDHIILGDKQYVSLRERGMI